MQYKYEYRSAFEPDEDEVFHTEEAFRQRFRNASPLFENFIEDEEIDILQVVCGPESYTLRRMYTNEV